MQHEAEGEEPWRDEKAEDERRRGVEEYKWEERRGSEKRGRKASLEDKEEREKKTQQRSHLRDCDLDSSPLPGSLFLMNVWLRLQQ